MAAAVRCLETSCTVFREFELDGGRYWVTIKHQPSPASLVLFEVTPVREKLSALLPVIRGNVLTVLGALLAAFLGATLLSRFFVVPIADISRGIEAIQRRDDQHRIPIHRQDEFGAVITAFNRLFTEFKELQYGRIVQESLLPGDPPVPPGYDVCCFRHSATDLAGDYHDVFKLPDGNWVFILGDVTGHGVSAALAAAMAKATVEYQALAGWSFPSEVLDRLNALFFRELKPRNKYMTLGCLRLNPTTHEIVFGNAGHPFPMIFRREAVKIEEISAPHLPLGMKATWVPDERLASLAPGDALMLYSDGFIECQNTRGEEFGIDGLSALWLRLMTQSLPLPEVFAHMKRELDEFRIPGPYPDDVTLVILRRLGE